MYKIIPFLVVISFLACEGIEDREVNCETVLCATDAIKITYRDSGGNPLLGTLFIKDSFKLFSANSIQYLKPLSPTEPENLAIFYAYIQNDLDYTLELSPTVIDTLNFTFTTNNNSCCSLSTMDQLLFNRKVEGPETTNFYIFIK